MKTLLIGDIFGRPGRRILRERLAALVDRYDVDLVIANGENAAGGFGLTRDVVKELRRAGVDVITGGNHTFDKKGILDLLDEDERLLRPHNYPPGNPGSGVAVVDVDGVCVAVINLQLRVFMPTTDCPFRAVDRVLEDLGAEPDLVFVDMHGEATSEKQAMGWYLDGRVAGVVGTHTHVPTADERVLPKGTAYISDLGMTGPHDSILGVKVEQSLSRFLTGRNVRFEPATGDVRLHGVLIDADERTGRARSIERVEDQLFS